MTRIGPGTVACFVIGGAATLAIGCAHAGGGGALSAGATEAYLDRLIAGDRAAIAGQFSAAPSIDDPFAGAVRGAEALDRFVGERHAWLAARAARLTPGPVTRA